MVAKTIAWVNLRRILECGWRILVIGQKRKVMRVNEWFWHMHIYNQKTLPGFIMVIIFSSLVLKPKMVYQERFLLSVQFSALAKIWAKINDVQSEAKNSWSWWSKNDWWLTWPPFWRPLLCTFMTFAWKFINYLSWAIRQLDGKWRSHMDVKLVIFKYLEQLCSTHEKMKKSHANFQF